MRINLIFAILIIFLVISGVAFASNNTSTSANLTNLSISKGLTSSSNLSSNTVNSLTNLNQTTSTFKNVVSPVSKYLYSLVLLIFVALLIYGIISIYSNFENIEDEARLKTIFQFVIGVSLILLLIPFIYIYITYFPQMINATAPNLLKVHSVIPFYIIGLNIFVAAILSLVGFLFAIKEYIKFVKTFQEDETKTQTQAARSEALTRLLGLTAFMFLSPFIVGMIFIFVTQIFFNFSIGISSTLMTHISAMNTTVSHLYYTNLESCNTGIIFQNIACDFEMVVYINAKNFYSPGIEILLLNAGVSVMTNPMGSNVVFMAVYDLFILVLMIYSFAKIDWYSLNYISTLKTDEEAKNYEKLKHSYLQYLMFIISPILFMITIIILNNLLVVMYSMLQQSNFALLPPLINLLGLPTATNLFIIVGGLIMSFFSLILLTVLILVALLRLLGGILFPIGIFLYFSENYRYRMFGRNLLLAFVVIYMLPIIIILLYSIFFGLFPSFISGALGYGNAQAVQTTVGSFTATPLSSNNLGLTVSGNGFSQEVYCNNQSSIDNATANLGSISDSRDGLGAMLGGCEQFVGYWSNGYVIMALVAMILLIISIFGVGSFTGSVGGMLGIGGSGATSLTAGLHGKTTTEKISNMLKVAADNRKKFGEKGFDALVNKGMLNKRFTSLGGKLIKGASFAENIGYGITTAPITGTSLGNALDTMHTSTKKFISGSMVDFTSKISGEDSVYMSKKKLEEYANAKHITANQAKRLLKKKYSVEFLRNGTVKMKRKDFNQLEKDANIKLRSSEIPYLSKELRDEEKEWEKAEGNYKETEKRFKNGEIKEAEFKKERKKYNFEKKKFKKLLKANGFKSHEEYKDKKKLYGAIRVLENRENKKPEEIDAAKENLISVLTKYGTDKGEINKFLKNPSKIEDLTNVVALGEEIAEISQNKRKGNKFIANAINTSSPIVPVVFRTAIGSVGRSFKTEFMNPAKNSIYEKYKMASDVVGTMKEYVFVSGIPLTDQYNNKIEDFETKITKINSSIGEQIAIIKSKDALQEQKVEARKRFESLYDQLNDLRKEQNRLRSIKDTIGTMTPVLKGFVGAKDSTKLPSLAMYRKMATGDDMGRIELSSKMLNNESRITKEKINKIKDEISKLEKDSANENLTPYQKIQNEKMLNEYKNKLNILNAENDLRNQTSDALNKMLENYEKLDKSKKNIFKVFNNNTLEKSAIGAVMTEMDRNKYYQKLLGSGLALKKINSYDGELYSLMNTLKRDEELKKEIPDGTFDEILNMKIDSVISDKINPDDKKEFEENSDYLKEALKRYQTKVKSHNNNNLNLSLIKDVFGEKSERTQLYVKKIQESYENKFFKGSGGFGYISTVAKKNLRKEERDVVIEDLKNLEKYMREFIAAGHYDHVDIEKKFYMETEKLNDVTKGFINEYKSNIKNLIQAGFNNVYPEIEEAMTESIKKEKEALLIEVSAVNDIGRKIEEQLNVKISKNKDAEALITITSNSVKDVLNSNSSVQFDFETIQRLLRDRLEKEKTNLGLSDKDVKTIASFDQSILNNPKLIEIGKSVIIPLIEDIKNNKAAKILKDLLTKIENNEINLNMAAKLDEIDAVADAVIASKIAEYQAAESEIYEEKKINMKGAKRAKYGNLNSLSEAHGSNDRENSDENKNSSKIGTDENKKEDNEEEIDLNKEFKKSSESNDGIYNDD